ncbi:hypothetical protein AGOR_G00234810 [Albula goreensis]|uniref:Ig-like domain-containing protein n=1 Tax=Albula goreensis TaxID=1534307 RepID=A0A8T3CLW7_9TELE|nr:hypothetical protein AGOR_G00234810 [Albula goreensis]
MDLLATLTLLYLIKPVSTGTHSLWYFVTLTAGHSPFPEMVIVGMVDDVPVEYYDSSDKTMLSRRHWHVEEENVAYAQMKRMAIAHAAHSLKNKLQRMKEHFNHSVTLHTYQRIAGCELDDDGKERFQAKDAYNGKDVLFYDLQSYTWSSLIPGMERDHWLMESYKGLFYQLYQPMCISTLKSYLHQERNILKGRVPPRVRVFQKEGGGAGGGEVTCLATGFYPRHIELTLQRDDHPVPDQELTSGDTLPNGDGTYQKRRSLSISAQELRERHHYTCTVRHVSVDNKLDIIWESHPGPDIALISGVSLTALAGVLLIVIGICIWRTRKCGEQGCSRTVKNEEEKERINAAAGEEKDGESLEIEREES